jgi:hypothetical protein
MGIHDSFLALDIAFEESQLTFSENKVAPHVGSAISRWVDFK